MPSPVIKLDQVTKCWEGHCVLPEVSLAIERGDFLAITGPNGGGKTTLLRVILKLIPPTSGRVLYLSESGKQTRSLNIGYVPQKSAVDPRFPITVAEAVTGGLLSRRPTGRVHDADARIRHALADFGLVDLAGNPLGHLSGGQLQRTLIARAFVADPEVIVLDEPLSYLDATHTHILIERLRKLRGHATVIVVSHDMTDLSGLATRHLIVDHDVCEICRRQHPHEMKDE